MRGLKISAAAAALLAATATSVFAQSASALEIDIDAQSLPAALRDFSEQTKVQVIYEQELVGGKSANTVHGIYEPTAALAMLLADTDLAVQEIDETTVAIVAKGAVREAVTEKDEEPFRLAQLGREGARALESENDGRDEREDEDDVIIVTGTNIRGVKNLAAPTLTIDRQEFKNAGFGTIEQLFESLPQNFDEITPDGRFANEGGSQLRGLNNARVTSVDLRGLGAQSTLTLVNGARRAGSVDGRVVDISAIPLSIIEQVEVVTGGRSSVYGADAVAGVVNLVTRRDFDGAETQAYFGFTPNGGGERLQLSQIFGVDGERGGVVAAYDYSREWPLELGEAGLLSLTPNPEIGLTQLTLNAQADSERHSAYLSGRYDIVDGVEVFAEGLYTNKEFDDFALRFFEGASENSFTKTHNASDHLSLSGGLNADLGDDWRLKLAGGWSMVENTNQSTTFVDLGFFDFTSDFEDKSQSDLTTISAVADGPLFSIGGVTPKAAIGFEWRREGFENAFNGVDNIDRDRKVRSAFAELVTPFVEDGEAGMRRLELSLAGRYDDYSDFGGTFNPQAGLIWEPVSGLSLRGAYSAAFRAPALVELESSVDAFLELANDPAVAGAFLPVLFIQGENPDLQPEEADTWSVGVDFAPESAPWANFSVSYYQISYDGRIEQPSVNADRELVLQRASRFPGLITVNPTSAEAAAFLNQDEDGFISNDTGVAFDPMTQDILTVFPDLVLFDNRTSNIAVENVKGIDFSLDTNFETGAGNLNFGVNLMHILEHDRSVTANSPSFSLINEVGKLADTRIRANAGWSKGASGAFVYVNYVDGYANPFSTPASRIDSWTTADVTLRFNGSEHQSGGLLDGLSASFSVKNVFDNDPPLFEDSLLGVLYDSTNASPFGRYLSFRVSKHW